MPRPPLSPPPAHARPASTSPRVASLLRALAERRRRRALSLQHLGPGG